LVIRSKVQKMVFSKCFNNTCKREEDSIIHSNDVSEQEKNYFRKPREYFVQNRSGKKNHFPVLHKCHCFREMSKIQLPREN